MNKDEIIKFFDRCSKDWDKYLVTDDEKMSIILSSAKIKAGKTVLDIACGTGVMIPYYLGVKVKSVTGIDISPKMIELAKDKFKSNKNVTLICGDADTIKFDNEFDACMIFNAFPHFINPQELLNNLKSAIKVGGTITIAHDMGRAELDNHHSGTASMVSNGLMSETELEKLLKDAGFINTIKYATDEIYIVSGTKE